MNRTRRKQLRNWLLHEGTAMGVVGMYPRYVALAWIAHYNLMWYDLNRNVVRAFLALPKPPDDWPEEGWIGASEKFKAYPHLGSIVMWLSKRIDGYVRVSGGCSRAAPPAQDGQSPFQPNAPHSRKLLRT